MASPKLMGRSGRNGSHPGNTGSALTRAAAQPKRSPQFSSANPKCQSHRDRPVFAAPASSPARAALETLTRASSQSPAFSPRRHSVGTAERGREPEVRTDHCWSEMAVNLQAPSLQLGFCCYLYAVCSQKIFKDSASPANDAEIVKRATITELC